MTLACTLKPMLHALLNETERSSPQSRLHTSTCRQTWTGARG